jgi:hypothetical protein
VLFDVNRTPAYATLERHGLLEAVVTHLADGIGSFLGE